MTLMFEVGTRHRVVSTKEVDFRKMIFQSEHRKGQCQVNELFTVSHKPPTIPINSSIWDGSHTQIRVSPNESPQKASCVFFTLARWTINVLCSVIC